MKYLILFVFLSLAACDAREQARDSYKAFQQNCFADSFSVQLIETNTEKTFMANCKKRNVVKLPLSKESEDGN